MRSEIILPPKLTAGDTVRLVSPASTPTREGVNKMKNALESMGLNVEIGHHVFDEWGYMAGKDEDRLADVNDAFRDPHVKAAITTRGGKGAYRIADGLDFATVRKQPKLLVGFSEITILHLALRKKCHLSGLHGAAWNAEDFGQESTDSFWKAAFTTEDIIIKSRDTEATTALTTQGKAHGMLIGGNQDMIATAAGWSLPSLRGAILFLEAFNLRLGHIDRQLTMLKNAGHLEGITGIAIGQYTECGADASTKGGWTEIDVLQDRLHRLNVPILGGLPLGHGKNPIAVPIGTMATLDAGRKTLHITTGVK